MESKNSIALGVDIGGSHITCQLYNLEKNVLIESTKVRKPVDCHSAKENILNTWAEAIRETALMVGFEKIAGIGFAMPGPFDYPEGVAWFRDVNKFDNLYGVNVRTEIRQRLQLPDNYPVMFQNDAACFAMGESLQGSAAQHRRLLAITLGTGFGTTFIDNHLPVAGKYGIPDDGFLYRVPFADSVADEYFSTRWFLKEYYKKTGLNVTGVQELVQISVIDPIVNDIFETFGSNLGEFLVPWLSNFEAGCLVIGGNISAAYPMFRYKMNFQFKKNNLNVPVYISTLQEDAALCGSASLCSK